MNSRCFCAVFCAFNIHGQGKALFFHCLQSGTSFFCIAEGTTELGQDAFDFWSLLGNGLDCATEFFGILDFFVLC